MTIHFLDTSAWAKLYVQEPGSSWLARWSATSPALVVSSLALIELLATLSRRRADATLPPPRFEDLYRMALDDASHGPILHFDGDVFELAINLPIHVPVRGADTVQLASLLLLRARMQEEGEEVVLVSSDRTLNDYAIAEGVRVIDPVENED